MFQYFTSYFFPEARPSLVPVIPAGCQWLVRLKEQIVSPIHSPQATPERDMACQIIRHEKQLPGFYYEKRTRSYEAFEAQGELG